MKNVWKSFVKIFDKIDKEAQEEAEAIGGLLSYRRQIWIVLLTATLMLFVLHYIKFSSSFHATVNFIESLIGDTQNRWYMQIRHSNYGQLLGHVWWASWHIILMLLIPASVAKFILRRPLSSFGWQLGLSFKHWKLYASIVLFFVLFLSIFAHFNSSFLHYYPFYRLAYRSWFDLISWEILYMAQFVALEFFFRGFILQGLRVPFGSMAIAIMIVPYTMIHLPKLWPEALGAIAFGVMLGVLAIRSRSIFGGVLIHASVALTLDISGIIHTRHLPILLI